MLVSVSSYYFSFKSSYIVKLLIDSMIKYINIDPHGYKPNYVRCSFHSTIPTKKRLYLIELSEPFSIKELLKI